MRKHVPWLLVCLLAGSLPTADHASTAASTSRATSSDLVAAMPDYAEIDFPFREAGEPVQGFSFGFDMFSGFMSDAFDIMGDVFSSGFDIFDMMTGMDPMTEWMRDSVMDPGQMLSLMEDISQGMLEDMPDYVGDMPASMAQAVFDTATSMNSLVGVVGDLVEFVPGTFDYVIAPQKPMIEAYRISTDMWRGAMQASDQAVAMAAGVAKLSSSMVDAAASVSRQLDALGLDDMMPFGGSCGCMGGMFGAMSAMFGTMSTAINGGVEVWSIGNRSMLRLSDDIGIMADRIGEMADRIVYTEELIGQMADRIGIMADRIVDTEQMGFNTVLNLAGRDNVAPVGPTANWAGAAQLAAVLTQNAAGAPQRRPVLLKPHNGATVQAGTPPVLAIAGNPEAYMIMASDVPTFAKTRTVVKLVHGDTTLASVWQELVQAHDATGHVYLAVQAMDDQYNVTGMSNAIRVKIAGL